MLILKMVRGRIITIGDEIKIICLGHDKNLNQCIVGIEAPQNIPILRSNAIKKKPRNPKDN